MLILSGAIATGIVMWIRERSEEHRAEKDHAIAARELEEAELELAAEEENSHFALEQERVRGLVLHGLGSHERGYR